MMQSIRSWTVPVLVLTGFLFLSTDQRMAEMNPQAQAAANCWDSSGKWSKKKKSLFEPVQFMFDGCF